MGITRETRIPKLNTLHKLFEEVEQFYHLPSITKNYYSFLSKLLKRICYKQLASL